MEKPQTTDCKFCNIVTPKQRSQLSTPSYKIKKEKLEAKKLESELSSTPSKDNVHSPNPSLVDPASVSVIGALHGQGTLQSPGFGEPAGKKQKKMDKVKATTSKAKLHTEKPAKSATDNRPARDSTDTRLAELDQKWSDRFNRLEALLMTRMLDKERTFQTVNVAPSHSPSAVAVKSTDPFIRLADRPATQSTPASSSLPLPTPLLKSISLPANFRLTNLKLTDQELLKWLVPNPLLHTDKLPRTISPVWNRRQRVTFQTGPCGFIRGRRGSCWKTRM